VSLLGIDRKAAYLIPISRYMSIQFLDLKRINSAFEPALTDAVKRVIDSGIYVRGKEVERFEHDYARYIGSRCCVGVGNGFDALRLIFRAMMLNGSLREGDEVLVPANTYIATILSILENRLRPVLVDPDEETMNLDVHQLERVLTKRTRCIVVVHLYGRNGFTNELRDFSARHSIPIIEDNAQAAGCMTAGRRTGSLGYAAAHSFFPTKNLGALGDGGAVTTDDNEFAETIRTLGHYGSDRKGHNPIVGVNSRLDELQAAVLNVKLGRLDADNELRRSIANQYTQRIGNPSVVLPEIPRDRFEHVWHLYVVRCKYRDELKTFLEAQGVETAIHYPVPPHHQPSMKEFRGLNLPVTEQIHDEALSLPLHPALRQEEIERICEIVSRFGS
jgi:dTDP-4-amino-4,6-dideoxygalactose transaminase